MDTEPVSLPKQMNFWRSTLYGLAECGKELPFLPVVLGVIGFCLLENYWRKFYGHRT